MIAQALNNILTINQIAAILQHDCGITKTHAEQLATAVVQRASNTTIAHVARYIAAEQVWRRTVCDEDSSRSLVTHAEPHTRVKLLEDVAQVDLELERVYEDRLDLAEIARARVHLKEHHADLATRKTTLKDKLIAFNARPQ
jgi:hypothetical protein